MTVDNIPEELKRFLNAYIDSISKLEVMLLLFKHAQSSWRVAEVSNELRSSPSSVALLLDDLVAHKILTVTNGLYQFNAQSIKLSSTVKELAKFYQEYHTSVIEWLYTRTTGNIQCFADAFIFRKEK